VAEKVAAFETFARKQEEVLFARSYVDLHREMDAHARGSDHAEEPRGGQAEQARRLRFTSKIFRQVGQVMNYDNFVSADGHQARIMLRVRDVGTRQTLDLVERLRQQLAVLFPADSGIEYRFTGDVYLNAQAMDVFVRDMFYSLLGASVFIFGVIGVCFRSVRIGLIAVPPNIMPLIITLGYMGLRRYDMNAANVIVFDMGLGIAVDSTIHFLSRFRHEYEECGSRPDSVRRTFASTGQAIVYTSLLIVAGLSILLLSSFVPTRRFAELTAVTMAAAFVGDIVLLPACVLLFWGRRRTTEPKADHHKPVATDGKNGSAVDKRIKERPAIAGRHDRGE
jgi:predicted RND superfamily exporter protein